MLHIRRYCFFAHGPAACAGPSFYDFQLPLSLSHEFLILFDSSDNFLSAVPSDSAGEMF
jgi:hypothetical protein